jgi:hypothetical protein
MRLDIPAVAVSVVLAFSTALYAQAPPRGAAPPNTTTPQPREEIKLDEATTLKAAALEARASALLANLALAQRQFQDMQQELQKVLEERKTLIQDAAKKANVEVKEPLEWALDNKGQRYQRVVRPSPPAAAPR